MNSFENNYNLPEKSIRIIVMVLSCVIILISAYFIFNAMTNNPTLLNTVSTAKTDRNLINGNWEYMPGVSKELNKLKVQPRELVVVEQDGSTSQKNPPVNVAGTYLDELKGDFLLTATINKPNDTKASMTFYGRVPVVADEFVVNREAVTITLEKSMVQITAYDQNNRERKIGAYRYIDSGATKLAFKRTGDTISIAVDTKEVAYLNNESIFASGQMWFGLAAENGAWELLSFTIEKIEGGSVSIKDASEFTDNAKLTDGLQELAGQKRNSFTVGSAVAINPFFTDPEYRQVIANAGNFGSMTPENAMKMINLQPLQGVYTYAYGDALVSAAKQHKQSIHGHTLVFGEANPKWLTNMPLETTEDKAVIQNIMTEHITNVMTHYRKDIYSWDVINEPLADYDDFSKEQPLREHLWYKAMGKEYLIKALETAHKSNPDAMLFINEYGLEADGERWDAMFTLLEDLKPQLKDKGIPIEKIGVGFQAHVYDNEDVINAQILRKHIRQLEKLGYKAHISEMDVTNQIGDRKQGLQYKDVFMACLLEPNCVAWRSWMLTDKYNYWKDDSGKIRQGVDGLYDNNLDPRPGYREIQNSLK